MHAAAACWQSAQAALARRDMAGARRHLLALLQLDPQHVYARVLLAGTVLAQGHLREAGQQLRQAAADVGDEPALVCRVAQALLRIGDSRSVHELLQRRARGVAADGATLATLAHVHQSLGEHAQALELMQRAQSQGYDTPEFQYFLGVQLQFNGQLQAAGDALSRCLRARPGHGRAALTCARLHRQTPASNHVDALRRQLPLAEPGSEDHAGLYFALYKELEDLGDAGAAWQALQQGNAVMQGRLRHDADADTGLHAQLAGLAHSGLFNAAGSADTGPQPIFIVGMPRSGTTVLERMLGNHSQVVSAGELGDFAHQLRWAADLAGRTLLDPPLLAALPELDYAAVGHGYLQQTRWRAAGKRWFIDKLPANYLLVGMIARALPGAVIVHMRRDPMAICFSNYRALFGDSYGYSYDFASLARHHRAYSGLMDAWRTQLPGRVLDIDYREMVQASDQALQRVLAACGLEVEAGASDLTRNAAASATLSSVQVREPVHTRNVDEWQRYATQLQPLQQLLDPSGTQ